MKSILETIGSAWGWCGLKPRSIFRENDFGNILVEDEEGRFWRIVPQELECTIVAENIGDLVTLMEQKEFAVDWSMANLIALAGNTLGSLADGRKYCLKLPGVLGGKYVAENLGTISFSELIAASGDMAEQIKDLPNGTKVNLKGT